MGRQRGWGLSVLLLRCVYDEGRGLFLKTRHETMGPNGTSTEHFHRPFVLVLFCCFERTLTKSTLERKGSVSVYKSQVKTHHRGKPEQELAHRPWRNGPSWLNRRLMLSKFLIQPRLSCLGMVSPIAGWTLLH